MIDNDILKTINKLSMSDRIKLLKEKMFSSSRYFSLEQARLITESYQNSEGEEKNIQRARALAHSLKNISIKIEPEELIVGNRTPDVRAGVVFPEAGVSWIDDELETLPTRPQDKFNVRERDKKVFRESILPYWKGKTLEDELKKRYGKQIKKMETVVKINQKDHAQGHICPDVKKWLKYGPAGLKEKAKKRLKKASKEQMDFYRGVITVLEASQVFIGRYGKLARDMILKNDELELKENDKENLNQISYICFKLVKSPPETFREALQSLWFLFVILQLESNASSFSPGRMDQYLYPYFEQDFYNDNLSISEDLELIETLYLKFNQIVYMRNEESARYFAGFPIGFNVAIGGQTDDGNDATNLLSYLFLQAQYHLGLPQPNLSARLHNNSPDKFINKCSRVIGQGSGMPQIFSDESIIPALKNQGISDSDAIDYAVVGCVELTTQGNYLGWSDAAMFNMVKVLELTLNDGKCMLTGKQLGPRTGYLTDYKDYQELEEAFKTQIDYFIEQMVKACEEVEKLHAEILPSPFLTSIINDCLEEGVDVTAGGAHYNFSGIQAIQVANIADSLAVLKKAVFENKSIEAGDLLSALRNNYRGFERLRMTCLNDIPKYGNDLEWVDEIANQWVKYFNNRLSKYENARGGKYQTGLYTVSAHVPMGHNVGATPDGRLARKPLADGGMSAVYGRDKTGPTALLKSVGRIDSKQASNGTLLNMKFTPDLFKTENGIKKFSDLLKAFIKLGIHHVQFNVVSKEDLISAQKNPEEYRGLTVRVAGYTAYFTELAEELQDEIIARTSYG